jgi:hypothetical protein
MYSTSITILKGEITMGVPELKYQIGYIADSIAGKFSSYKHNAEVAAGDANKTTEDKVVPITSINEAKKMAAEKDGLKDPSSVFGAARLTNPRSFFTAQAYCQNLGHREGTDLSISYSQDFKVAYCKEVPKQ